MANPALDSKRIEKVAEDLEPGWALAGMGAGAATAAGPGSAAPARPGKVMTAEGAFAKTFLLWLIVVAGAVFGWSKTTIPDFGQIKIPGFTWVALLVAFGLALVTIFKPKFAPVTAPLYAVAEGVFLGVISKVYDSQWNGIVLQAVLATVGVFLVCLALYVTGVVKVTKKFVFVVIAATAGIFVMYLAGFLLNLFGVDIMFWNQPGPLGIGISVVICIVAALNLFLDFEMIRQLGLAKAPKSMEWYAAFGLTVTMVWLYLEILRLLSKIRN